ncbi:ComF family protein [Candidatus Aerophobetes bacterium]|nr:ComF family protein [Candidatus Aerophobetes bacterium]
MLKRNLVSGVAGLFLPADCLLCKKPLEPLNRSFICFRCWQNIEWLPALCCARCRKPLFFTPGKNFTSPQVCPACRINPPHFQRLFSSTIYRGVMAEAIKLFKYTGKRGIMRGFIYVVKTCIEHFNLSFLGLEAIVPVPLHPRKQRERGYNQAEDIARMVGRYLNLPVWNSYLVRVRYTKPQTSLSKNERRENMKGAFSVPKRARNWAKGSKILLVDDVYTTGFTLNEASKEIKRYGAEVFSFTLARSP